MASTPRFGSTPRCGTVQLALADGTTPKDVGHFTPAAAGTRVKAIRCFSGPTAPGGTYTGYVLVHDGTSSFIVNTFTMTNSANSQQTILRYDTLILPSGYKLQVATGTALAASATLDFVVDGEDQT